MAKVYNVQNQEVDTINCCQFEVHKVEQSIQEEFTSSYSEVLNILKKALEMIDISSFFKIG